MLTYTYLKEHPKTFLAVTGLTVPEFVQLLPTFETQYQQAYPPTRRVDGQVRQRRAGAGRKARLANMEDKLLFSLCYHKLYSLQTAHGLHFGMSQGRANEWIHRLSPLLQASLDQLGMSPLREGQQVRDSPLAQEGALDLLIDGTERRRQRPQDALEQKAHYSGKKKTHTDKNILVSQVHSRKVVYLSPTTSGAVHDKKLADASDLAYPDQTILSKDTGFQGYEPPQTLTLQPQKSRKDVL